MQRFDVATWSTASKVVSALATLVLLGAAVALSLATPRGRRTLLAETFAEAVGQPC